MMTNVKSLGIMKPLGGGDPIPLKKEELMVGRRPTCDIRLDFENVSGRHCQLRYIKGVWHVRDLNSTNGTTVNGQKISSEHGLMPDDELGIAGHYYTIDYDPVAPSSLIDANMILEEEMSEAPRHRSLMELAGLETGEDAANRLLHRPVPPAPARPSAPDLPPPPAARPRVSRDDGDEPAVPAAGRDEVAYTDDDFFEMIRQDVEEEPGRPRR